MRQVEGYMGVVVWRLIVLVRCVWACVVQRGDDAQPVSADFAALLDTVGGKGPCWLLDDGRQHEEWWEG